jgi:RNA polymerase sigma factor (sigma-70 family)
VLRDALSLELFQLTVRVVLEEFPDLFAGDGPHTPPEGAAGRTAAASPGGMPAFRGEFPVSDADPAAAVLGKLDAEQVSEAIGMLPEEYRIVAALYFLNEFPYERIAEIVGCPVGTVRSRLHRGRKMLQKALWHLAAPDGGREAAPHAAAEGARAGGG